MDGVAEGLGSFHHTCSKWGDRAGVRQNPQAHNSPFPATSGNAGTSLRWPGNANVQRCASPGAPRSISEPDGAPCRVPVNAPDVPVSVPVTARRGARIALSLPPGREVGVVVVFGLTAYRIGLTDFAIFGRLGGL